MATVGQEEKFIRIETDCYQASVQTEGYVSGVSAGSFIDKRTGASDLSFGLCIADFLLEPGIEDSDTSGDFCYHWGDAVHGNIPKRYVELPQICTQAGKLPYEILEGKDFVAVHQWYNWNSARFTYDGGSWWEQWLVVPDGVGWFLAYDKVTSINTVDKLILRMDMPGHIKHQKGDEFDRIYLSYYDCISSKAFVKDFSPDVHYLYQRQKNKIPKRYIRSYQLSSGTWLAGMALDPSIVYEAWCHQRGYVCMIQEMGGILIREGESFGAVHLVGFFESIEEMEDVFDTYRGTKTMRVEAAGWSLET